MTAVLVDSNVLLDIATGDPVWSTWSQDSVARIAEVSVLVIDPIIYGEVSAGFDTIEEVDAILPPTHFRREPIPYEAAFLAAKSYLIYRRRGGVRSAPLPDFYIGAHAAVRGYQLLTRDAARYRTYFPRLALIAPG